MKNLFLLLFLSISVYAFSQPAGSLDNTFGNAGKVVISVSSGAEKVYGTVIQSDGKILVAGHTTSTITGRDFLCIRLKSNGTPDSTFGANGIVTTDLQLGSEDGASDLALQTDGKIILAGYSDNGVNKNAAMVRYKTDGSIDSTFGTNGIVLTDFENSQQDQISVIKIHTVTGKIIVGGSTQISTNVSKPVVARYLNNGTLDNTFNTAGIRLLWVTNLDYQYLFNLEDLVVQPNGKISFVGWRDFPTLPPSADKWAGQLNSDGSMDVTFSTDGVAVYNGGFNGNDKNFGLVLTSNNNFITAGAAYINTISYDYSLSNLNSSGTVNNSAGFDFSATTDEDIAYSIAEDVNGNYVVGGVTGTGANRSFAIARLTPTLALDNTFNTNGKITTTFGNALNECFDLLVQPDNKVVAVGYSGNDVALARYLGNNVPNLNAFQLITPNNNATAQNYANLVFDWSDAYGAASYQIEISTDAGFSAPTNYTVATSTKTVANLSPNTQYYWRVKASDGSSWGNYSAVWNFTTNTLENFSLLSPPNNSAGQNFQSVAFDWSDAVGATSYELEIDSSQNFSSGKYFVDFISINKNCN